MSRHFIASTRLIAAALLLATAGAAAYAEPPRWREHQERSERAKDRRPVRDVVGEVEHHYRGHVIDVQPPAANDDRYRVRVLQESGRVKTLHVPAQRERERGRER